VSQPFVARLFGALRRRLGAERAGDCRAGRFVAVIDCIINQMCATGAPPVFRR
jgi:hypothetical protein